MNDREIYQQQSQQLLSKISEEFTDNFWQQERVYPWNPAAREVEAYFDQLDREFRLTDSLNPGEIEAGTANLFASFSQCWESENVARVKQSLFQSFGDFVPYSCLEAIAERAGTIRQANGCSLSQLVECVQPLLSDWTEEDLRLFAFPFISKVPGRIYEVAQTAVRLKQQQWEDLSRIDQVRYVMAISQHALLQLRTENQQ
ncbi:MAG: hypothetical protein AB4038_20475 [Prochloraceae cyanobacterium]